MTKKRVAGSPGNTKSSTALGTKSMIIIQQQNKTVALMCSYLQLTNDGFHQGVTKERTLVPAWTNQKNSDFLLIH